MIVTKRPTNLLSRGCFFVHGWNWRPWQTCGIPGGSRRAGRAGPRPKTGTYPGPPSAGSHPDRHLESHPVHKKQTDSFNSFICLSKVYTLSIYQLTNIFLNKTLYQCLSKIYYCHTWAAARFSASSFLLVAGKKTISSIVWISSSCTTHLISRPWKSFWSVDTSVITQQQRFTVYLL